jgi:hypothetical protein
MKKSLYIIILSGLIICSILSAFAQEKVITEQELTALKETAYEKLKDKTYRVTMTSEGYGKVNDLSSKYSISEVNEYVSSDRHHIREMKNQQGTTHEESISIGQKKYVKENNKNWRLLPPSESGNKNFGTVGGPLNHEKTVVCKYLGEKNIKNQKADLYEIKTTRKYNNPNLRLTTEDVERLWFNKDGMFLMRESKSRLNDEKVFTKTIWEYEYDPNIKIEAPIIKSESKQTPK